MLVNHPPDHDGIGLAKCRALGVRESARLAAKAEPLDTSDGREDPRAIWMVWPI